MPFYSVAVFGAVPPAALAARIEAVTPGVAAEQASKGPLSGRRIDHTRYAHVGKVWYYIAADKAQPEDELILTVKEVP